jgi:hypothetical protein
MQTASIVRKEDPRAMIWCNEAAGQGLFRPSEGKLALPSQKKKFVHGILDTHTYAIHVSGILKKYLDGNLDRVLLNDCQDCQNASIDGGLGLDGFIRD